MFKQIISQRQMQLMPADKVITKLQTLNSKISGYADKKWDEIKPEERKNLEMSYLEMLSISKDIDQKNESQNNFLNLSKKYFEVIPEDVRKDLEKNGTNEKINIKYNFTEEERGFIKQLRESTANYIEWKSERQVEEKEVFNAIVTTKEIVETRKIQIKDRIDSLAKELQEAGDNLGDAKFRKSLNNIIREVNGYSYYHDFSSFVGLSSEDKGLDTSEKKFSTIEFKPKDGQYFKINSKLPARE